MIPDKDPLSAGMIVRHDPEGGLLYHVAGVAPDTDGYETKHALNGYGRVAYTQLEDGDYPAGSRWDKNEAEFRANFTVVKHVDDDSEQTEATAAIQKLHKGQWPDRRALAKALADIFSRGYTLTTADVKFIVPYYGYSVNTSPADIFGGSTIRKIIKARGVDLQKYKYGTYNVYLDGNIPPEETDIRQTIAALNKLY